jgi:hypothetical protein
MHHHTKLLLVAMATTALMALAVGTASAGRLSVDEQNFRITWSSLEFVDPGLAIRILCPATLEGSFHARTIVKVERSLIGYVTAAQVKEDSCIGGRATVDRTSLPWHVTYERFSGTLPNIERVQLLLRGPVFRLSVAGINCTARVGNIRGEIETGVREGGGAWKPDLLIPDNVQRTPCGIANGVFEGNGRITKLNSTAKILLRLI